MRGQIKPVGVPIQTNDGQVIGTFQLIREGRDTLLFSVSVPPNGSQAEIGQAVLNKCVAIMSQEPAPAFSVLEQMVAAGQVWTLPDPPAGN